MMTLLRQDRLLTRTLGTFAKRGRPNGASRQQVAVGGEPFHQGVDVNLFGFRLCDRIAFRLKLLRYLHHGSTSPGSNGKGLLFWDAFFDSLITLDSIHPVYFSSQAAAKVLEGRADAKLVVAEDRKPGERPPAPRRTFHRQPLGRPRAGPAHGHKHRHVVGRGVAHAGMMAVWDHDHDKAVHPSTHALAAPRSAG
jgi:hypothetical protein